MAALQKYDPFVANTNAIKRVAGASQGAGGPNAYSDRAFLASLINDLIDQLSTAQTNPQTGTAYTVAATDNGKIVTFNNAAAITVTIPIGLGAGFSCGFIQLGAGQVTFQGDGTSTVNSYTALLKLAGQYAMASLVAYLADTFALGGTLA